ncbi:DUF4440 domain-containing protein [Ohtaekwangia sp.]|uniref:DUF4440 domain-containing protein n=1 Tax=Ohtaekwangia sp. TaxID=2066019 RepID=UPI002FDD48AC
MNHYRLIFVLLFSTYCAAAQKAATFSDTIQNVSQRWDKAFNLKDTSAYYSYIDTLFSITYSGGTATGLQKLKFITQRLYANRPDIRLYFGVEKAESNDKHDTAYDTGTWTETWTEKGDSSKSEVTGKYWRMWRKQNNRWIITSIALTTLSCKGSYCNK